MKDFKPDISTGPPRSISIAGVFPGRDPRTAIEWAARTGARAVQLDAARPGLRPRELGRSARRDIASTLRRCGLDFSGIDLWIPARHFSDSAHAERAAGALVAALELAGELADLCGAPAAIARGANRVVCIALDPDAKPDVLRSAADFAASIEARIADHRWPAAPGPERALAIGLDAGVIAAAGADPVAEAARLAAHAASARVSEPPGGLRTDLAAYRAALAAGGYGGFMVIDVRAGADAAGNLLER